MTLPGPPTQHGIYANPEWTGQPYPSLGWQNIRQDQEPPEGWPRPPKFNKPGDVPGPPVQYGDPITPQTVKAGYGFIDNGIIEKNLYFYHPDHLGSSSYITDREGRITQHTEYIAFGEVLFEEHSTSKTMPYLFNGKELDQETNLTYFGARYLDMKTSLWLNTDPLSGYNPIQETEHYIDGQHNNGVFNPMNHNTYGYTYNNPIIYIDPNGKQTYFDAGALIQQQLNSTWNTIVEKIVSPFRYTPTRDTKGNIVIDHTLNAVEHYYRGNGESVNLGPKTLQEIKNSEDMQYYRGRLKQGLTPSPSEGSGLPINMTIESARSYHVGRTNMKYNTNCDTTNCTTTYTLYGDGFYDIFWGEDKKGPNGELGGTPYNYNPTSWSETYKNPGYKIDNDGRPIKIPDKATIGKGAPNKNNYSSLSIPIQYDYLNK